MKRYQVYLNPQSVETIDVLEKEIKMTRSGIIRLAIDALARNLILALPVKNTKRDLDDLIGIITPKAKKSTNFADQADNKYLVD